MRSWHAIIRDHSGTTDRFSLSLPNATSRRKAVTHFHSLFFLDDWTACDTTSAVWRDGDPEPVWDASTERFVRGVA